MKDVQNGINSDTEIQKIDINSSRKISFANSLMVFNTKMLKWPENEHFTKNF